MKFYAYIKNMTYAKYCINREDYGEEYDMEIFTEDFLRTVGTTKIVTELQEQHTTYDMFWCYVEIKEGWCVKLI